MSWFRLRVLLAAGTIAVLQLCSCSNHDEELLGVAPRTLLVYLGCDNNLSSEAVAKLNALARGVKGSRSNLLAYQDAAGEQGTPKLWRITDNGGELGAIVLEKEYPEHSSASPEILARVVSDVVQAFPASSYGLLVFSHGSGWLPGGALASPKSIIVDGREEMEITEFANALPSNLFEYIVFESCFMASVEVAYQLRHKTKYVLASAAEMLSPGFEQIYPTHLSKLLGANADLSGFASAYFRYFDSMPGSSRAATVSLIKTEGLEELAKKVKECTSAASMQHIDYTRLQYFDRRLGGNLFYDLGGLMKEISPSVNYTNFVEALDRCVLLKQSTPTFLLGYGGFDITSHCGLTTYIQQQRYPVLNSAYKQLDWYKAVYENAP